jgi:5-methylcytosine-specific restriction protein A
MPISGWTSPRRAVARYGDKLFETTKINIALDSQEFPDEITEANCVEGARESVHVNRYERDSTAKRKCIGKWGIICVVCDFDFEKKYGCRGAGFIHVHHLIPLSEIRQEYSLDPIADLRPICPNCHSIIHRYKPAISIEALKKLLNKPAEALRMGT